MDFRCKVCGQIYETEARAKSCEESHNIVYIEFTREELFKLVNFLYTKDESILPETLVRKLLKYKRGFYD